MSTKRLTTEIFISRSKKIHGDKYDYSKVEYVNQTTKVCIICPIHGEFWQTPKLHMNGRGCPKCGNITIREKLSNKKKSTSNSKHKKRDRFVANNEYKEHQINDTGSFIMYSEKLHSYKYDYSKAEYKNKSTKVCIICPEHGEFWQTPHSHLIGHGCPKCGHKITDFKLSYTFEEFVEMANKKYNGKYTYKKEQYKGYMVKMKMVCPEHGEFWQTPSYHIDGCGCSKCVNEHRRKLFSLGKERFIEKSSDIFHSYYSYNNVSYVNNNTKVLITCPKHGDFLCTPANHLKGRGCPICKSEHYVGETKLYWLLKDAFKEEEIYRQYRADWLSNCKSIDFFIPNYKIAIEHQGQQHFESVEHFGGENKFKRCVELDTEKYKECTLQGITLLYFSYGEHKVPSEYFEKVYTDEKEFIEKLKELKYE
jgi:hypothetical protein